MFLAECQTCNFHAQLRSANFDAATAEAENLHRDSSPNCTGVSVVKEVPTSNQF